MNAYEEVTSRVLAALDRGVVPWVKPWTGPQGPANLQSGRRYRGCNVLLLGLAGYQSPWWLTYRQAEAMGGHVRQGERGTRVYLWKAVDQPPDGDPEVDDGRATSRLVARAFTVFKAKQCEGIEVPAPPPCAHVPAVERAEALLANIRPAPVVRHGGGQAFFSVSADLIQLPPREAFRSADSYYSTRSNETVHWTGHRDRLARSTMTQMQHFGDEAYSKEELVAEMGAGFLAALTGIENEDLAANRGAYIANWLRRLQDDRRLVVSAVGHAQSAVDWILSEQKGRD